MRLLVCGGRDYTDGPRIASVLSQLEHNRQPIDILIHGDAPGADRIAAEWAEVNGIIVIACPADWDLYGRSAGPKRNAEMLEKHTPTLVIAFGGNRGTSDMIGKARKAGVEVIEVDR